MEISESKEVLEVLFEISKVLNTGLDQESLKICVELCEAGVNPEALAAAIINLRNDKSEIMQS